MRGTVIMITWILVVCLSKGEVQGQYYSQSRPYDPKALKVTNLHFFMHSTFAGNNPTSVMVAQPNNSSGPFSFGAVYANDHPLKIGPELSSEVIGNAQGLEVITDKNGTTVVMLFDFGFTTGEFKGSSISIFSRNPITELEREVSVVGGRGKFRMANGFAQLKTYSFSDTSVIIDCKVTLIHYKDDDN